MTAKKLTKEQLGEARVRRSKGESYRDIAHDFGVAHTTLMEALGREQETGRGGILPVERAAMDRMLAQMANGPDFHAKWSPLDMQTVLLAMRRIARE